MKSYKVKYYSSRFEQTHYAALTVLQSLFELISPPSSMVDVGCGVGAWLKIAQDKLNVAEIHGVDGPWVNPKQLTISPETFTSMDLSQPIELNRRFDMASSLEVAEHIRPEYADTFVQSMTALSDTILFGAAVPYQGGRNHFNEQWPSYWQERFAAHDYFCLDALRPRLWNDNAIPYWYRQNILLYVSTSRLDELCVSAPALKESIVTDSANAFIHPDLYRNRIPQTYHACLKLFLKNLRDVTRIRFGVKKPLA